MKGFTELKEVEQLEAINGGGTMGVIGGGLIIVAGILSGGGAIVVGGAVASGALAIASAL